MKIKLLSLILLSTVLGWNLRAQTQLWGTCGYGGVNGAGIIFTAASDGSNLHTVYNFVNATGQQPVGNLCMANNGHLYGVTYLGGWGDSCVCFDYDPITGNYTDFYDLYQNTATGWEAWSGMIKSYNGNLFGTCASGGANGNGVIYKVDPTNDTYTDVFDFLSADGQDPFGSLTELSDHKLYGMTYAGGANYIGVIFSFDPATSSYTNLYDLTASTGFYPFYGKLIQTTNGKLYGVTSMGGIYNFGVIFSFDLGTSTYADLYDFDSINGANPRGSLMQASNGNLYGMSYLGGSNGMGVLFSFDINTNTYTNLLNFNGTNGSNPMRGITQATNGMLYGSTNSGGANSGGVAFSYDIATNTYTVLTNFSSATNGTNPDGEIIETPQIVATGIASINKNTSISIFPIPATDHITIAGADKEQVIVITDVLGREIDEVKTTAFGNTTVNVSEFPNVFFLKLPSGETQKIVKE